MQQLTLCGASRENKCAVIIIRDAAAVFLRRSLCLVRLPSFHLSLLSLSLSFSPQLFRGILSRSLAPSFSRVPILEASNFPAT